MMTTRRPVRLFALRAVVHAHQMSSSMTVRMMLSYDATAIVCTNMLSVPYQTSKHELASLPS